MIDPKLAGRSAPYFVSHYVQQDARRMLSAFEADSLLTSIPPVYKPQWRRGIRRVYTLSELSAPSELGAHALMQQHSVLSMAQGSCMLRIHNGESEWQTPLMAGEAVYLPAGTWRDLFDFSPRSVVLKICNLENTDEEVVRDKARFIQLVHDLLVFEGR